MSDARLRLGPRRLLVAALSLSVALAAIGGLARLAGVDPAEVLAVMHRLPLWAWAAVALAQAVIIFLAALKWQLVLAATAPSVPALGLGEATSATTLGTLAGQVLPIQLITPVLRAWVAHRRAVPVPVALGTSALEQAFDVMVLVATGAISAIVLSSAASPLQSLLPGAVVAAILLVVLAFAARPILRLVSTVADTGAACTGGLAASSMAALARGLRAAARLDSRTLGLVTSISAVRFVLIAGLNVGVLHLLAPGASISVAILAFPVVLLMTSLPIFPAGLGVVELTWSGTLVAAGLSPEASVAAALALRIIGTGGFLVAVPALLAPLAASPQGRTTVTA